MKVTEKWPQYIPVIMWILAGKNRAYVNGQSQDTQLIAGHDLRTEHCLPVPLTSLRWLETLFLL